VSFVLHDVFEVPFNAIAAILDRSTAATVTGGAITMIRTLTDPGRLAQIVPSWVA
jgi:hypothetical protein